MDSINISKRAAILTILSLFLIVNYANSQENKNGKSNKPDIKYDVKKEYDKNGNIIRYDSTYSYSWSSDGFLPFDIDSVFNSLNQNFSFKMDFDHGFGWPFENDSSTNDPFNFSDNLSKLPFDWSQWINDSTFFDNRFDEFGGDFQELLKHQQEMMDQFMKRFDRGNSFYYSFPEDTVPDSYPNNKQVKLQKQNNKQYKKSANSIII